MNTLLTVSGHAHERYYDEVGLLEMYPDEVRSKELKHEEIIWGRKPNTSIGQSGTGDIVVSSVSAKPKCSNAIGPCMYSGGIRSDNCNFLIHGSSNVLLHIDHYKRAINVLLIDDLRHDFFIGGGIADDCEEYLFILAKLFQDETGVHPLIIPPLSIKEGGISKAVTVNQKALKVFQGDNNEHIPKIAKRSFRYEHRVRNALLDAVDRLVTRDWQIFDES